MDVVRFLAATPLLLAVLLVAAYLAAESVAMSALPAPSQDTVVEPFGDVGDGSRR